MPSVAPSEIIPGKLWQSHLPDVYVLSYVHPDRIVDCTWFKDEPHLPDMNKLSNMADWMASEIKQGHKVLVHCLAGWNRSSLLTCLILMRLNTQWSGAQAVKHLESRRPGVLTNQVFRDYLMRLQQESAALLDGDIAL